MLKIIKKILGIATTAIALIIFAMMCMVGTAIILAPLTFDATRELFIAIYVVTIALFVIR